MSLNWTVDTQRYLTQDIKARSLNHWLMAKDDYRQQKEDGTLPSRPGGMGYPDPEIYQLCDRLNAFDGICTMQSCAGHLHPEEEPGEDAMWSGELWIATTKPIQERFVYSVRELLQHDDIERARLIFLPDSPDVIDIIFQGMNKGLLTLNISANIICDYVEKIAEGGWYK